MTTADTITARETIARVYGLLGQAALELRQLENLLDAPTRTCCRCGDCIGGVDYCTTASGDVQHTRCLP